MTLACIARAMNSEPFGIEFSAIENCCIGGRRIDRSWNGMVLCGSAAVSSGSNAIISKGRNIPRDRSSVWRVHVGSLSKALR